MREADSLALSHSLGIAQQYYQAPTMSNTYSAYSIMQDIICGARAASPTKENIITGASPTEEEEGEDMMLVDTEESYEEEERMIRKVEKAHSRGTEKDRIESEKKTQNTR